jgi:hypothetical protein
LTSKEGQGKNGNRGAAPPVGGPSLLFFQISSGGASGAAIRNFLTISIALSSSSEHLSNMINDDDKKDNHRCMTTISQFLEKKENGLSE